MERYGVHAVVANLLHTRHDRVLIVHDGQPQQQGQQPDQQKPAAVNGGVSGLVVEDVRRPAGEPQIERILVAKVVELHSRFQQQQQQR